ncbi:MAG TPA: GNAT family N-acetyltransferase [Alphaproteobacteria bacterium]|nr:GNAT family N-acetyltransferase [Alphaproteobacteria bacterium]
MTTLTVEAVSDIRTLVTLEPAWWSLWHRARSATPFQSPAWLIPWWRAFAPGELFVVVVWQSARLLGMLPLYIDSTSTDVRLLPLGVSVSDYIDVLVDAAWENEVLAAFAGFLATGPTPWAEWDMPDLPAEALALALPASIAGEDIVTATTPAPVLTLPTDAGGLDAAIPARKRRDIRMARHRADRRGPVDIQRADAASVAGAIDELVRLHSARWHNRGEAGVLADDRLRRFHGEAAPRLVQANLARIHTLSIGGEIAGVYYGLAYNQRHYAYLCGFDPAFERESPGTILIAHAIEDAVCEGAAEFHFLRGGEAYKYQWGAVDRWNSHRAIRRSPRHALAS